MFALKAIPDSSIPFGFDNYYLYTNIPFLLVIICLIYAYLKFNKQRQHYDWESNDSVENQAYIMESRDVLMQPKKPAAPLPMGANLRFPKYSLIDVLFGIVVLAVSIFFMYIIWFEAQYY